MYVHALITVGNLWKFCHYSDEDSPCEECRPNIISIALVIIIIFNNSCDKNFELEIVLGHSIRLQLQLNIVLLRRNFYHQCSQLSIRISIERKQVPLSYISWIHISDYFRRIPKFGRRIHKILNVQYLQRFSIFCGRWEYDVLIFVKFCEKLYSQVTQDANVYSALTASQWKKCISLVVLINIVWLFHKLVPLFNEMWIVVKRFQQAD